MHIHAHTHARAHAQDARARTHAHAHTSAGTHARTHACRLHAQTHTHKRELYEQYVACAPTHATAAVMQDAPRAKPVASAAIEKLATKAREGFAMPNSTLPDDIRQLGRWTPKRGAALYQREEGLFQFKIGLTRIGLGHVD